jgi:tetratricopeptide (TPR) repeat protein
MFVGGQHQLNLDAAALSEGNGTQSTTRGSHSEEDRATSHKREILLPAVDLELAPAVKKLEEQAGQLETAADALKAEHDNAAVDAFEVAAGKVARAAEEVRENPTDESAIEEFETATDELKNAAHALEGEIGDKQYQKIASAVDEFEKATDHLLAADDGEADMAGAMSKASNALESLVEATTGMVPEADDVKTSDTYKALNEVNEMLNALVGDLTVEFGGREVDTYLGLSVENLEEAIDTFIADPTSEASIEGLEHAADVLKNAAGYLDDEAVSTAANAFEDTADQLAGLDGQQAEVDKVASDMVQVLKDVVKAVKSTIEEGNTVDKIDPTAINKAGVLFDIDNPSVKDNDGDGKISKGDTVSGNFFSVSGPINSTDIVSQDNADHINGALGSKLDLNSEERSQLHQIVNRIPDNLTPEQKALYDPVPLQVVGVLDVDKSGELSEGDIVYSRADIPSIGQKSGGSPFYHRLTANDIKQINGGNVVTPPSTQDDRIVQTINDVVGSPNLKLAKLSEQLLSSANDLMDKLGTKDKAASAYEEAVEQLEEAIDTFAADPNSEASIEGFEKAADSLKQATAGLENKLSDDSMYQALSKAVTELEEAVDKLSGLDGQQGKLSEVTPDIASALEALNKAVAAAAKPETAGSNNVDGSEPHEQPEPVSVKEPTKVSVDGDLSREHFPGNGDLSGQPFPEDTEVEHPGIAIDFEPIDRDPFYPTRAPSGGGRLEAVATNLKRSAIDIAGKLNMPELNRFEAAADRLEAAADVLSMSPKDKDAITEFKAATHEFKDVIHTLDGKVRGSAYEKATSAVNDLVKAAERFRAIDDPGPKIMFDNDLAMNDAARAINKLDNVVNSDLKSDSEPPIFDDAIPLPLPQPSSSIIDDISSPGVGVLPSGTVNAISEAISEIDISTFE